MLGAVAAVTAAASLLLGLAAGASLNRAVSLGFYVVGSFMLLAGFFLGNRGPVRLTHDADGSPLGPRKVRWASREERESALNDSAVFVTIGFALLVLGVAVDTRTRLV